ncbi:RpiR family transcriptional regulator [Paenibacillus sp. FSL H8-0548]|uniref:MurR/RpiR family transcriptional regulator n=1 Tax=Paenibacillus sp. FSL H8-0548 TaxID=1920422 RepID=UPI00096DF07C|nr:MurR/RpiR family transcriptional regulator [Paenibacillus sp. FSL H8-0548]OMF38660.1 RpiR family transcriptional regulator [Paenibacillus sp. FSL H8-0548]
MLKGALIRMEEAFHMLTPMEKKTAEYILKHPSETVNMSVQKLAELAEVSEATIVRLSRTLNCKGFQDLKLKIAADLSYSPSDSETDSYQEIRSEAAVSDLVQSISHNNIKSIQDTILVLSVEALEQAIHKLQRARKIAIFGIGASAIIAEDFQQKLMRINRWCESGYSFNAQATIAANLNENDVALGISYSGQTKDTIRSLEIAKENGANVISLTKFGSNPVANLADICLHTSSLEKSIRTGAMASRMAQLNIIDILYVGIASGNIEENIQLLERTRLAVSSSKQNK